MGLDGVGIRSPVPRPYTRSAGKPKDILRTRSRGPLLVRVPLRREAPSEKNSISECLCSSEEVLRG